MVRRRGTTKIFRDRDSRDQRCAVNSRNFVRTRNSHFIHKKVLLYENIIIITHRCCSLALERSKLLSVPDSDWITRTKSQ